MTERRGNLGERREDEVSLEHARMGDLEIGCGDDFVSVKEDVEVDQARAFGERFLAAHLRFDFAERSEKLNSRKIGLRLEDGVEEPRLVEIIDRLGFVDAGKFCDVDTGFSEETNGFAQVFLAVANVGAEREVDGDHIQRLFYANAAAKHTEHGVGFGQF